MLGDVDIVHCRVGDADAIDEGAGLADPPGLELAVLRTGELPPVRRVDPALVAIVARRCPCADRNIVDPQRDVGRPVHVGAGRFRRQLHGELDRLDRGVEKLGVVGEFVFDVAAAEPDQRGLHARRVEEGVGNVEKADYAICRAQTARRADLDGGEQAERHRHLDDIRVPPRLVRLEPHDDLVETRRAYLLVAFLGLDRLGHDQPRLFQRLHVDCNGGLRQAELVADVVDVEPALAAQQLEDADADRRRQPLENVDVLFRIDGKEVGFHDSCDVPRPAEAAVFISEFLIVQPCRKHEVRPRHGVAVIGLRTSGRRWQRASCGVSQLLLCTLVLLSRDSPCRRRPTREPIP